jgi:hypothetical protein
VPSLDRAGDRAEHGHKKDDSGLRIPLDTTLPYHYVWWRIRQHSGVDR